MAPTLTTTPTAQAIPRLDNDQVTVTEWRFAPGTSTGFHRHGMDYVVVPLTGGRLTLLLKKEDGSIEEREFELSPGVAYTRTAGTEHEVIRKDDGMEGDVAFVEVEMKAYRG